MHTGLDRLAHLPALLDRLRASRVGLLAHPASIDSGFRHVADVLEGLGIMPRIYFGPEHGYGGEAQDMIGVQSAAHPTTGAPIVSLYGDQLSSLSPSPEHLAAIDLLVIDLADVGSRYYTFIWTALLALRAAAARGVHVVVLDRPNPLGQHPAQIEGSLPDILSFVGLEPVPVRHGLTVAEVVALFAERDGLAIGPDGALSIVPVTHDPPEPRASSRSADAADAADAADPSWVDGFGWDRPFVPTSPNMPTLDTALVYPGGCLIEGTNLSEGRGTTRPFELVGAPFLDGRRLARALVDGGLPGFTARALTFTPMFHKHAGKVCGGVQIHVTDRRAFRPYATYLALIGHARALSGEAFRFRTERYEFVDDKPAIDLLTGSARYREALLAGASPDELALALSKAPAGWSDAQQRARRITRTWGSWAPERD
jgi:uncharacterized protein YbbC (DUF1343 family)